MLPSREPEPEPEPEFPTSGSFGFMIMTAPGQEIPRDLAGIRALMASQRSQKQERQRGFEKQRLEWRASQEARELNERRHAALAMAVLACTPTIADAVRRLHRPWSAGPPLRVSPEMVPGLLRVRGADWGASLARHLLRRSGSRIRGAAHWPFTEALMRAVGAGPPDTPAAVAQYVAMWRGNSSLAALLAADPWLDHVVPYLFDDDRVAAAFVTGVAGRNWPPALLELAATGRIDRRTLIAGCLRRLRAGGRKGLLQPYLNLLGQLAPTLDELAEHRQELIGLLTAPMSTVATFAYTALRDLHRVSALHPAALLEITQSMLSRQEKTLVRAHVKWLRTLPLEPVLDGLVVGLFHPVPELAERTLDLIEKGLPTLAEDSRKRLRAELPALDGTVAHRLAGLLGAAPPAPVAVPTRVAEPPAEMPPPLDLGALASELTILFRKGNEDPVRHELLLDGLVRAARGDRAAADRILKPMIPQWTGPWPCVVAAATGSYVSHDTPYRVAEPHPVTRLLERRLTELAERLLKEPPPALLATPATVAGHVDPARVLDLLRKADHDGWQPGHADLTQAILRLPREVDEVVQAGARRLVSPAGRRFAAALATRIEPRTRMEEVGHQPYRSGRGIAIVDPAGLPAELADPLGAVQRINYLRSTAGLALWPMITPSHREVMAAHLQPFVAAAVERGNIASGILTGLANADGPPGPAMWSTMAYALANHRRSVRLAAGDALIALADRPDWDSAGIGAEIGGLAAAGRIVLQRVVQPLTEVLRAGAREAAWQVTSVALPMLLPAGARPGLADLVTLAADAAPGDRQVDLPDLAALATDPRRNRLTEAARWFAARTAGASA
ncbi:hypothetical protein D7193_11740 [Micromonospora costi]|uniref:DUF6493 domain-containing protein n=1 Tax=Micromonospora costi TaxID=1530042 RepID=A0A3B0A4J8_9ACTN|nr:hypothetical protein D7193_11740 [Micromonospora costi]